MNEIQQKDDASQFAIAYQDNGKFSVCVLDTAGKVVVDLDVSSVLGLDNLSKPIDSIFNPLITVCWLPNDRLFVSTYHRIKKRQYYFIYQVNTGKVEGNPEQIDVEGTDSQRNYPIKSFYSSVHKECYTFYLQSQCFTMNPDPARRSSKMNKIHNGELGSMYLLFDKALVCQSSGTIRFFKQDEFGIWTEYFKVAEEGGKKLRGMLYFIKHNVRIQVTTDEHIFFYIIDQETLLPRLENVMNNFMGCSQMMFGSKVRFCVTFKQN
jgi:hypothetical protein